MKAHPTKTTLFQFDATSMQLTSWSFLGFSFAGWVAMPSDSAVANLFLDLEHLVRTNMAYAIPAKIRGWAKHFGISGPLDFFSDLDEQILAQYGWLGIRLPSLAQACAGTPTRRGPQTPRAKKTGNGPRSSRQKTERSY